MGTGPTADAGRRATPSCGKRHKAMLEFLVAIKSGSKAVVKRQHRKSDAKRYRSDQKRFGSDMKCVKRHEAARSVVKRHLADIDLSVAEVKWLKAGSPL